MKFTSYWLDTAPRFAAASTAPVEGAFDVAIIGGGFTGLSAARALAKGGLKVAVLEAMTVGAGGSGRNGGHLNNGLAHSYTGAKAALGAERAKALWAAYDAAIDTIARVAEEEGIEANFRRSGKLKLASKPGHLPAMRANFEAIHREVDPDTAFLERHALAGEIDATGFHGGMLQRRSAMMHMGRYLAGLADAVIRRGGTIWEGAPVTARRQEAGRTTLVTPRGSLSAREAILAGGATTSGPFDHFRRRIVPVGSFIVATRPLTAAEIAASLPGRRTYVSSLNIGNYFRLAPDDRLIWGGRARFSTVSNEASDARSGAILKASLHRTLPALAGVDIDYCWGGLVDITEDRLPRAGRADGVWFAMGYSGHGAQLAHEMGLRLAEAILGQHPDRNPLDGLAWPAVPAYAGKPWFLPLVGLYYKTKDLIH